MHSLSRCSFPTYALPAGLLALAATTLAQAPAPDFAAVERQFRELPREARRHTGPLFWLHGDETAEHLRDYVGKVDDGGNGSLTAESRPHADWLGPGWYRDLDIVLAECRRRGLQMWIFDEKWWPSQSVAGTVPTRYAAKRLTASAIDVAGGRACAMAVPAERLIAVLAGRVTDGDAIDPASLVDLQPFVRDGALQWTAPAGNWRVMTFRHETAPGLGQVGGRELSVDGMSRDCVQWFLDTVYQPHHDRFGADFGTTIVGFFYDEPETRGDWGTELPVVLAERGVDWKAAYVAYRFRLAGEAQDAYRFQYLDARAETWGRVMYGMTTQWCEARGVQSIGHFMEHGSLYRHQDFCAGDVMQLQKYSSMGGIDAVFSQFQWGKREAYDAPCWQTPKLGSSISHAYGKQDDLAMVEIFGARGQDLTYPEMKWWTDAMQVAGVNFLIPHSFNPRAPHDTDCPPYFYNGGHEPRWPLYRVFADYTSRLGVLLRGGRHVAPIALVTPGQAFAVGKALPIEGASAALQDALYDCDWIPGEVLVKDMQIDGAGLRLRDERYRVLCLPPAEVVPYDVLAKAKAFFDAGGVVVAHGLLPMRSATPGQSAADLAVLREALFGAGGPSFDVCRRNAAGGRTFFLPENPTAAQWQQVLGSAGVRPTCEVLAGPTDGWLHVLHRVKAGRDVFFVTNQDLGAVRNYRLRLTTNGVPEAWDAMRNEITSLPYTRRGDGVELELTLEPNDSILLVCQPTARSLPPRRTAFAASQGFPIVRDVSPPTAPLPPLGDDGPARVLADGAWVWHPDGDALHEAPAGDCCFRRRVVLPDRPIQSARFVLTADNHAELRINGDAAGTTDGAPEGWRRPVVLDVQRWLRAGDNLLALRATNAAGAGANPAGVIGVLSVEFAAGEPLVVRIDRSWTSHLGAPAGWEKPDASDDGWAPAKELAGFGAAPWGPVGRGRLTLSPVAADPFDGHVELPPDIDLAKACIDLECDDLAPEAAARITVNGRYAGGFLGRPFRLDVTPLLRPGTNTVRIEPFAPRHARLVVRN
jgi:hypothetical protein